MRLSVRVLVLCTPILAVLLAGCGGGGGAPAATFRDAVVTTERTLHDLLLGVQAERLATSPVKPEPPLLQEGVYETVLVAVDAEGFAKVSRTSVDVEIARELEQRVLDRLNLRLEPAGFEARRVEFGAEPAETQRALLVTLTPTTEETGSPRERAEGRARTLLLIRLTVADAETGTPLRVREYYSGFDVRR